MSDLNKLKMATLCLDGFSRRACTQGEKSELFVSLLVSNSNVYDHYMEK